MLQVEGCRAQGLADLCLALCARASDSRLCKVARAQVLNSKPQISNPEQKTEYSNPSTLMLEPAVCKWRILTYPLPSPGRVPFNWVALNELKLSCHNMGI